MTTFTPSLRLAARPLAVAATVGAALLAGAAAASGATYTAHDAASLAAAVRAADALSAPSTISLSSGVYAPDATLSVDRNITITGPSAPGSKIIGGAVMPVGASVFVVGPNAHATFVDLTVTNGGRVGGDAALDVTGALDLESSTLSGNSGPNLTVESGGSATVRNSTLTDGLGAGLVDDGTVKVINSTIAGNAVEGIDDSVGSVSLVNSIVAGNGAADCSARAGATDHSLDGDGTCGVGALSGRNPQLGPILAGNGGPTPTRALAAGSPAIDAGDDAECPAVDQRHYARSDGKCDIGAYEVGARPPGATPRGPGGAPTTPTPSPSSAGARAPGGASGHGVLRGPHRTAIKFTVHARVGPPHGTFVYHDAARRVWLKSTRVASVRIDGGRGTATITGTGTNRFGRRSVRFTAVVVDHGRARSLSIRLSTGYTGGGRLISGAIAFTA